MAVRPGIDLVDVDEVRAALLRLSERYLRRVYTDREVAECTGPAGADPRRLALRFAAKEATLKALGTDGSPVPLRTIELSEGRDGPVVVLTAQARALAERRGVAALDVSVGHVGATAFAIVLAEVGP